MTEAALVLVALLLVLACAVFVAAEFAFVGVDRASVERAAARDEPGARGTLAALRTLSTQLSAAQLGITVTNLAIGFLAEPAVARLVDGPLLAAGLAPGAATGVSLTLALVVSTAVTMIFGELVPKNLAISTPLRTARAVQAPMRAFTRLTRPVVALLNNTSNGLVRAVGVEPTEELASARSAEELLSLVRRSGEQGALAPGTATLVQRTLTFAERRAADVMTPRGTITSLHPDDTVADLLDRAAATGVSRFPVLAPPAAGVAPGVAHVRDAVGVPHGERAGTPVAALVRPVEAVPESLDLDRLLTLLRTSPVQLALVVDEYGDLAGLVTLEDLVEEIVGEVRDEHDREATPHRRLGPDSWRVAGRTRPDEASDLLGLALPEPEESDTLAGLVAEHLGRVPEQGDTVTVPATSPGGELGEVVRTPVTLTVEAVQGWRVTTVRLDAERSGGGRSGGGRSDRGPNA